MTATLRVCTQPNMFLMSAVDVFLHAPAFKKKCNSCPLVARFSLLASIFEQSNIAHTYTYTHTHTQPHTHTQITHTHTSHLDTTHTTHIYTIIQASYTHTQTRTCTHTHAYPPPTQSPIRFFLSVHSCTFTFLSLSFGRS